MYLTIRRVFVIPLACVALLLSALTVPGSLVTYAAGHQPQRSPIDTATSMHGHPVGVRTASSTGCEQNLVSIGGVHYYQCEALASPCLRVREFPSLSAPVLGCLSFGTTVYVYCQQNSTFPDGTVNGSPIWDDIYWTGNLVFISDDYVNTANYAIFSPPIPECFFGGSI